MPTPLFRSLTALFAQTALTAQPHTVTRTPQPASISRTFPTSASDRVSAMA